VQFLEETALSVFAQTYANWEWIIVDDASTDGSNDVLKEIAQKEPRIKLVLNSINSGANKCRNQGVQLSIGDYLIFLDADDMLAPNCIEQRVSRINKKPNHDLWVFPMGVFKSRIGDTLTGNWFLPNVESDFLSLYLKHQLPWAICQPIWRKTFFNSINGFNENYIRLQDVELHTRAIINYAKITTFQNAKIDCYYRIDADRSELNAYEFMIKFINGSIKYYTDFYSQINTNYQKQLAGTLLEPLSIVCFHLRCKSITTDQAKDLVNLLINTCRISSQKRWLKLYFTLNKISPIHPVGLKKIISFLL
jgi:glycosyltransferase involved in cell wall biosynthesis